MGYIFQTGISIFLAMFAYIVSEKAISPQFCRLAQYLWFCTGYVSNKSLRFISDEVWLSGTFRIAQGILKTCG
jgi:hypothetical protein